jgi:hypothetical protein
MTATAIASPAKMLPAMTTRSAGNARPRLCRAVVYQRRLPLGINGETWLRPASRAATRAAGAAGQPVANYHQHRRVRQRRRMP